LEGINLMDDKRKDREKEFQRSKERLARFNQEMEKVKPKPTLRQWIKDAVVVVATGAACGAVTPETG
jgi:hypothetical protein